LKCYHDAKTADQKITILSALGYAKHNDLIERALKFAISEEVRNQDIIYSLSG